MVEEHIRCENEHDLEGVMAAFGDHAEHEDRPWDEHHRGRGAVRGYYDRVAVLEQPGLRHDPAACGVVSASSRGIP